MKPLGRVVKIICAALMVDAGRRVLGLETPGHRLPVTHALMQQWTAPRRPDTSYNELSAHSRGKHN